MRHVLLRPVPRNSGGLLRHRPRHAWSTGGPAPERRRASDMVLAIIGAALLGGLGLAAAASALAPALTP